MVRYRHFLLQLLVEQYRGSELDRGRGGARRQLRHTHILHLVAIFLYEKMRRLASHRPAEERRKGRGRERWFSLVGGGRRTLNPIRQRLRRVRVMVLMLAIWERREAGDLKYVSRRQ